MAKKTNVAARKAFNTIKKINSYATPVLTGASIAMPQFAPAFAGAKGVLSAAEGVSKNFV
jgi:hypothetical protein